MQRTADAGQRTVEDIWPDLSQEYAIVLLA